MSTKSDQVEFDLHHAFNIACDASCLVITLGVQRDMAHFAQCNVVRSIGVIKPDKGQKYINIR